MKISVIIVCLNSEKFIRSSINSIVNQNYKNIEIIVIDGGSTDLTLTILTEYRDQIYKLVSEPDLGIYDAMNKGLNLATGQIIGFLNSDDFYPNQYSLERIKDSFAKYNCDLSYSDLIYVDRNNIDRVTRTWSSADFNFKKFKYGISPAHPTFYISANLLNKVGLFNTKYILAADFDFMRRCFNSSVKAIYINEVLVNMRAGGATNNSLKNILNQNIEIYLSIYGTFSIFKFILFLFIKIVNKFNHY